MKPHRRKDPGWTWKQHAVYAVVCVVVLVGGAWLITGCSSAPEKPSGPLEYEIPLVMLDGTVTALTVEDNNPGTMRFRYCQERPDQAAIDCMVEDGDKSGWVTLGAT